MVSVQTGHSWDGFWICRHVGHSEGSAQGGQHLWELAKHMYFQSHQLGQLSPSQTKPSN